jgi:DNA-binding transcriptional LysR family regulator
MRDEHAAALRAFRLIARHGSFTRAAAELEVTPSALSQTLKQLEASVGVRLLHRTTRQVGLTEAGTDFLARITPALNEIDAAMDALRQHGERPAGTLRVTMPQNLLDWLIGPVLMEFLRTYPDVKLEVLCDSRLVDLVAEGFDVGIRLGERLARDVVAVPLGDKVRAVVIGSPAYFARHGRPQHPRDLEQHACVRYRYVGSGAIYRWEFAHRSGASRGQWFDMDVDGPITTNEPAIGIHAALEGLALMHAMEPMVRKSIAAGLLETVLDPWLPPFDGLYLYYPSRFQVPPKLRVFIDFLRERLANKL